MRSGVARSDVKSAIIKIRVTTQQHKLLASAAAKAGLSLSSWMRTVALGAVAK